MRRSRRLGERPLRVQRIGLAGSSSVRYEATIQHGRGTRTVHVDVPAREILAIADAIRATANEACARHRTGHPSDALSVGHAIWHLDNPDRPMPCITGQIIDVEPGDGLLPPPWQAVAGALVDDAGDPMPGAPGDAPEDEATSIEELLLPIRATTVLVAAEVRTIEQLCQMTGGQLRGLPGSSELVVLAIRRALDQVGAGLRGDAMDVKARSSHLAELATTVPIDQALRPLRHAFTEASPPDYWATSRRERFEKSIGDAVRAALLAYGDGHDLDDASRRLLEAHCQEWERMSGPASSDHELAIDVSVLLAAVEQASHARRHPNSRDA